MKAEQCRISKAFSNLHIVAVHCIYQHIPYLVSIVNCKHIASAAVSFKDLVHRGTLPVKQQMWRISYGLFRTQ